MRMIMNKRKIILIMLWIIITKIDDTDKAEDDNKKRMTIPMRQLFMVYNCENSEKDEIEADNEEDDIDNAEDDYEKQRDDPDDSHGDNEETDDNTGYRD